MLGDSPLTLRCGLWTPLVSFYFDPAPNFFWAMSSPLSGVIEGSPVKLVPHNLTSCVWHCMLPVTCVRGGGQRGTGWPALLLPLEPVAGPVRPPNTSTRPLGGVYDFDWPGGAWLHGH